MSVTFTERWCPSNRQPHEPVFDGSPNTLMKYQFGLRTFAPFVPSSSLRMLSRLMIVLACSKPLVLRPALSRLSAAAFWSAVMSSMLDALAGRLLIGLLRREEPCRAVRVVELERGLRPQVGGECAEERLRGVRLGRAARLVALSHEHGTEADHGDGADQQCGMK